MDKIKSTIHLLDKYGTHHEHVNLPVAVNEAEILLDKIKSIVNDNVDNVLDNLECGKNLLDEWKNTNLMLNDQMNDIVDIREQLNDLNMRLDDTIDNAYKTERILNEAIDLHKLNLLNYDNLQNINYKINTFKSDLNDIFNTSIIPKTDISFSQLNDNHDKIDRDIETIDALRKMLENLLNDNAKVLYDIRNNYQLEVTDHANDLMERAKEYSNMFKSTKDGAEAALLARYYISFQKIYMLELLFTTYLIDTENIFILLYNFSTAHKNIIEAIEAAKAAANHTHEAVEKSQNELYPDGSESVIDKGIKSLNKSLAIQNDALIVNDKLNGMQNNFIICIY